MHPEVEALLDNLDRLRRHAESVRAGSLTARDDIAAVLTLLTGGGDGYGLLKRGFDALGLDLPRTALWSKDIETEIDGRQVLLAIRTIADDGQATGSLLEHLDETCLRFAVPGFEPEASWSYSKLIKKVRNKFGSHADPKPPEWLRELRYYPAGDSDAVTLLLWSAAETTLTSATTALVQAGIDIETYRPADHYLNGVEMTQAYVMGRPSEKLAVAARVKCATWASGSRRALVGAVFGDRAFVFGLEGDSRLAFKLGEPGSSVNDVVNEFRAHG